MRCERNSVLGEFDDIDLLAAQLANDGLHAHALHSDASAYAVHIAIAAGDGNFGPLAGFAGTTFYYNRVVVNLWNFLLEQTHHQLRRAAGNNDAGILAGLLHALDHAADALAHAEVFELALLFLGHARFGLAQIHHQVLALQPFHGAVHQFAYSAGILRVNGLTLGFADLLQDDLLGGLRGNAPQGFRGFRKPQLGFQLCARID